MFHNCKIINLRAKQVFWNQFHWEILVAALCMTLYVLLNGSKHLFSILHLLLTKPTIRHLRIDALTTAALQDWHLIINQSDQLAVPIMNLVPQALHFFAATIASKFGMGGFWMPTNLVMGKHPCVWHHQWLLHYNTDSYPRTTC